VPLEYELVADRMYEARGQLPPRSVNSTLDRTSVVPPVTYTRPSSSERCCSSGSTPSSPGDARLRSRDGPRLAVIRHRTGA
jgi:hypothetical protein